MSVTFGLKPAQMLPGNSPHTPPTEISEQNILFGLVLQHCQKNNAWHISLTCGDE